MQIMRHTGCGVLLLPKPFAKVNRTRRNQLVLELSVATEKQRRAAKQNIKKAAQAARKKRTIAHLPKATRTALGKQAAKVRNNS
jgi:hypothetical protein